MERIQKIIANSGMCSRRKAERLIEKGLVTVNGQKAKLGQKASYTDNIIVENKLLNKKEEKVYFLLNKPRGVVSTVTDDKERKTITSLINTDKRIYPIGRLDYDTTGAIILTNDGELANILMHPKNRIERSYYVKVEGFITKEELNRFKHPILVENKTCNIEYCKIKKYDKKTNTSYVLMILKEGHNHEVKNIFKAINHPVIKLKRESFAELRVDNLKSGEYRKLLPKEIKKLYSYKKEERK
ncbi:MAG: rRNA pseudouridine synthase [Bacilli bacterium]|nr:rRNA pseudouridine synthase [Bacilli bacterium]